MLPTWILVHNFAINYSMDTVFKTSNIKYLVNIAKHAAFLTLLRLGKQLDCEEDDVVSFVLL